MNDTNSVSISQLKMNPMAAINMADDYPLEVENRGSSVAYLVGKKLFEKLIEYIEDAEDTKAIKQMIKSGEIGKGRDFEEFAKELGI